MKTRMRAGHERWFIINVRHDRYADVIRCECGETFPGLVTWSDHASDGTALKEKNG